MSIETVLAYLEQNQSRHLEQLCDWLRMLVLGGYCLTSPADERTFVTCILRAHVSCYVLILQHNNKRNISNKTPIIKQRYLVGLVCTVRILTLTCHWHFAQHFVRGDLVCTAFAGPPMSSKMLCCLLP